MNYIISCNDAKAQGLTRYFTNQPCKKGHIAERLVKGRTCVECKRLNERKSETKKNYNALRYKKNRMEILTKAKARYKKHGPQRTYAKIWRTDNANKIRQYRKDRAGLYAFHAARRRKLIKLATPPWFEYNDVASLYEKCAELTKESGVLHEVDHIIPIKHSLVCGLHCLDNLRILTAFENRSKNNQFVPILSELS